MIGKKLLHFLYLSKKHVLTLNCSYIFYLYLLDVNNCDCVIFIKNLKQETINKIEFFNVKTIKMQSSIKSRIINYRWKLYEDYLRNNTGKYKFVLCIDVRDSFFQKDIFKCNSL